MRIILNLLPLKVGGGVQVALDFIQNAQNQSLGKQHEWLVVASDDTPFAEICSASNFQKSHIVKNNILSRAWFELFGCGRIVQGFQPNVVFTLFGVHWWGERTVPQVVGCAFPYLAYKDAINLWDSEPFFERVRLKASIWHNTRQLHNADAVVFETAVMAERTTRNLGLDIQKTHVVHPACSSLVTPKQSHSETAIRCSDLPDGYRILLIAGHSPHKNVFFLPRVAEVLKKRERMQDVVFVSTLAPEDSKTRLFLIDADQRDVASMIYNFGPVPQEGCAELYSAVDAVILPSRVESFSNTVAEAWTMKKPLLVSDLDWAREACGDGAQYFQYDDATNAARAIVDLRGGGNRSSQLIDAGKRMMGKYPTSAERFQQYMGVIEAHGMGKETANKG